MALDEPKDSDNVFKVDGFDYIIDKELLERAKPVKVDFQGMGFKLDCGIDFGAGGSCSGCGSASTGCGS
jgi:iron-sulfur cluster assembly protein